MGMGCCVVSGRAFAKKLPWPFRNVEGYLYRRQKSLKSLNTTDKGTQLSYETDMTEDRAGWPEDGDSSG